MELNGSNVGSNSSTYSNNLLSNNDIVSCQYNSQNQCPTLATLGTGTATNTATSNNGAFFPTAFGNGRQQYLIRASELSAAGFVAGNITSIGINVSSSTVGNPVTLNNYTIKMAATTNLVTTTTFMTPTFTTVYGPSNYTPTVSSINTLNLSTPYYWDGSSNMVIEICFSNQVTGATAYRNTYSTMAYNAGTNYQVQGATSTVCSQATGSLTTRRPNFRLNVIPTYSVLSNSITMGINPTVTPNVSIAVTTGNNPSCVGSNITFTATATNGGSSPNYQWKVNGVNVGTNVATYSSSTLANNDVVTCILTSNALCASTTTASSNSITMTINPVIVPSVSITASTTTLCAGTTVNFTATPVNGGTPSFQWKLNGANVGTNAATYSSSTLTNNSVVTCVLTSNASCASPTTAGSNSITMTVNPVIVPSVSITASTTTLCAGTTVNFTATPVNGGTPSYQWKLNGTNVGTNAATYSSSTITNNNVVTCVLTSNASCASPTTANSNAITMTVNPVLVPSVSIVASATTLCAGTTVNFTATPINGGTPSYQWKLNGANVGTNSATYSSSTLTNNNVVTCILTSNASCASPTTVSSNAITMTVNPVLVPSVSIVASTTTLCAGTTVNFTATPINGGTPSYQWKLNGANVGTNAATYSSSTLTNNDVVTCILTSNALCASPTLVSSNGLTMTVNPIPVVSAGSYSNLCAGTASINLTGSPSGGTYIGAGVSGNTFNQVPQEPSQLRIAILISMVVRTLPIHP